MSITVTSLTDFLSFLVGALTPFPCVRIFCIYTGVAVGFIYLWHVTFFGGCLVGLLILLMFLQLQLSVTFPKSQVCLPP